MRRDRTSRTTPITSRNVEPSSKPVPMIARPQTVGVLRPQHARQRFVDDDHPPVVAVSRASGQTAGHDRDADALQVARRDDAELGDRRLLAGERTFAQLHLAVHPRRAIGSMLIAPTETTPGSARSALRTAARTDGSDPRRPAAQARDGLTPKVSTPSVAMPMSCRVICCRLFTVRPATATSITASAISLITSTRVSARARPAVAPRVEPSRARRSAAPARRERPAARRRGSRRGSRHRRKERRTAGSRPIDARRGKFAGASTAKRRSRADREADRAGRRR